MALDTTVRSALTRISRALEEFAAERGWNSTEYRILSIVSQEWGSIRVFFIVKDFGSTSQHAMRREVWDHLEKKLSSGPDIGYSVGLSVRSWDQVNQGGLYSIPSDYQDVSDLLNAVSVAN